MLKYFKSISSYEARECKRKTCLTTEFYTSSPLHWSPWETQSFPNLSLHVSPFVAFTMWWFCIYLCLDVTNF